MTRLLLLAALCLAPLAASAQNVRDYMMRALDVGESVSGVLDDPVAKVWRERSGSTEPVQIQVDILQRFKQEGCARLKVTIWQNHVPLKDGRKLPAALPYELNLCRNGMPPTEAVDMKALRKQIEEAQQRAKTQTK